MLQCPKCGKFYTTKKEMLKHIREAHKEKIPFIGRDKNINT